MPLGLVPAMMSSRPSSSVCGVEAAPPKGVRVAEGVQSAWLLGEGPFGCTPRRANSGAKRAGLRYEKKALAYLSGLFGRRFTPHQWFKFYDGSGVRFCEVDGLLREGDDITIFEVKVGFCIEAWWQLRRLYEPVVRKVFSPKSVALVVVCKSYDPAVAFPEACQQTQLLTGWRDELNGIGVFQWRA